MVVSCMRRNALWAPGAAEVCATGGPPFVPAVQYRRYDAGSALPVCQCQCDSTLLFALDAHPLLPPVCVGAGAGPAVAQLRHPETSPVGCLPCVPLATPNIHLHAPSVFPVVLRVSSLSSVFLSSARFFVDVFPFASVPIHFRSLLLFSMVS